jgi:hypothetical protein
MEDAIEYDENEDQQSTTDYPETTYDGIRVGGVAGREAAAAAASSSSGGSSRNDNLAVGMLLNRTFVNRGSQIGVFRHDAAGLLEYVNNVPVVRDMQKEAFAPSNMMLYDQVSETQTQCTRARGRCAAPLCAHDAPRAHRWSWLLLFSSAPPLGHENAPSQPEQQGSGVRDGSRVRQGDPGVQRR